MENVEDAFAYFSVQFPNQDLRLRTEHVHKSLQNSRVEGRQDEFPVHAPRGHCSEKCFVVEQLSYVCLSWPGEEQGVGQTSESCR